MSQGFWVRISPGSEGVRSSVWPFSASTDRDLSRKKNTMKNILFRKSYEQNKICFSKKDRIFEILDIEIFEHFEIFDFPKTYFQFLKIIFVHVIFHSIVWRYRI